MHLAFRLKTNKKNHLWRGWTILINSQSVVRAIFWHLTVSWHWVCVDHSWCKRKTIWPALARINTADKATGRCEVLLTGLKKGEINKDLKKYQKPFFKSVHAGEHSVWILSRFVKQQLKIYFFSLNAATPSYMQLLLQNMTFLLCKKGQTKHREL